MNDPLDILFEHGWKVVSKDVAINTGDNIYIIAHEDNPDRKFRITMSEE